MGHSEYNHALAVAEGSNTPAKASIPRILLYGILINTVAEDPLSPLILILSNQLAPITYHSSLFTHLLDNWII
jgi:hypothetical protein